MINWIEKLEMKIKIVFVKEQKKNWIVNLQIRNCE